MGNYFARNIFLDFPRFARGIFQSVFLQSVPGLRNFKALQVYWNGGAFPIIQIMVSLEMSDCELLWKGELGQCNEKVKRKVLLWRLGKCTDDRYCQSRYLIPSQSIESLRLILNDNITSSLSSVCPLKARACLVHLWLSHKKTPERLMKDSSSNM